MSDILINLRGVLRTTPQRWHALAEHFPEELLRRRPAPGEWSALECLQHLIDLDRAVFPARVRALLAGANFPAFFPETDGTPLSAQVAPTTLATEFAELRFANMTLVDTLAPADLERRAVHAELGPVTLGNLLHEWGGHDLMHLMQAERALMQPFIAGCGAWRVYFEEHVMSDE